MAANDAGQLEYRLPGRRLSAEWRLVSDGDASVHADAIDSGKPPERNLHDELGYAFDEDETRGILAGIQYTNVFFDSNLPKVNPTVVGYVGGYYQWDSNWKLTGRVGVQSFGGAQLLNIEPIKPFTQPIVRLDLEKLDASDNRVFGITAEVAWTPKPAFALVLRTPLYMVKN